MLCRFGHNAEVKSEASGDKALVILSGEIKTPPIARDARRDIGFLIRKLQQGVKLQMPQSRPMPTIGSRCHELRVGDRGQTWRVIYRTDPGAILVVALFSKKTEKTPKKVVQQVKRLLAEYDAN